MFRSVIWQELFAKMLEKIVNAKSIQTIDLYNRIEGHRSLSSKQKMAVRVRSNRVDRGTVKSEV